VVQLMFNWVANEGLHLRAVVRRLQELNIKQEGVREECGVPAPSHSLRNRAYIGEAHWAVRMLSYGKNSKECKYRKIKKSSRRVKRRRMIASKIPVPPIIERDCLRGLENS